MLAVLSVAAQPTGDWRQGMMGGSMGGGFGGILGAIFFIGLTILVWLWVVKLWRELSKKK